MYRLPAIAVLLAATAFQPSLEAQMRARPAFPTRTGLGSFRGGVRQPIDPFFCQQFFFPNRFAFAQPVYIPYPVYAAPSYQVADPTATVTDRYGDLAGEVGRLTSEVEQLRQQQALREQARQPSPPSPIVENTPTILVFRNGHRSEIRNYAIVEKTLWVFTEQRARKIPVSDVDVEATRRVNAERGVEVPFP